MIPALPALLALLTLFTLSCARPTRTVVALTPPALPPAERLRNDLQEIFGASQFERTLWAVLIQSTTSPDPLFSLNSSKLVMPASNMKLLTLAAAAEMFGWDYTFETKVVSAGMVDAGVLRGDLVVVGSGDPSISERSDRPGVLQSWAQQLWDLGIRRIDGRIVGDDDAFDDQGFAPGWAWDNLPYGYSAPVGALEYNEGSADLTVRAGSVPGEAVAIQLAPPGSGLEIENRLITVSESGAGMLTLQRLPGSSRLEVTGQIPAKAAPFVRTASVDNPTSFFVRALQAALLARGIAVDGEPVDIDVLAPKPNLSAARTLIAQRSPPLRELATSMMKVSQNQYAELLLKALAAREGTGSTETGGRMVREILRTWGLADDSLIVSDGSGLSRYNYVTAEVLVSVLQRLHEDPTHATAFPPTLPVAGRDGTLAGRLAGTPAEGNVQAKTGTIDNARALSGYVTTKDGETLVFSMIANNFSGPASAVDEAVDRALILLATFSR